MGGVLDDPHDPPGPGELDDLPDRVLVAEERARRRPIQPDAGLSRWMGLSRWIGLGGRDTRQRSIPTVRK